MSVLRHWGSDSKEATDYLGSNGGAEATRWEGLFLRPPSCRFALLSRTCSALLLLPCPWPPPPPFSFHEGYWVPLHPMLE